MVGRLGFLKKGLLAMPLSPCSCRHQISWSKSTNSSVHHGISTRKSQLAVVVLCFKGVLALALRLFFVS